jgi:hypothetical protein
MFLDVNLIRICGLTAQPKITERGSATFRGKFEASIPHEASAFLDVMFPRLY